MAASRLVGSYPVIGIRPTIDGRQGYMKVRESLEEQTMNMAKSAAALFRENLFYSNGLFILIINNSNKISNEFYSNLKRLEFIYPKKIINTMEQANLIKLKEIIYTLFLIYNSNFKSIMCKFDREILVNLYLTCKDHNTDDFFNYYRQSIINKYIDTS